MTRISRKHILATALISLPMLSSLSANADEVQSLVIEDFVGTIFWSNGGNQVDVTQREKASDVDISTEAEGMKINGGVREPDGDKCEDFGGSYNFSLFGKKEKKGVLGGYKDLENYPTLTLSFPADTSLKLRNSIVFTKGSPNISDADLSLIHCGNINLGNVAGEVKVEGRGATDLTIKNAQTLHSEMSGSGDIEAENVEFVGTQSNGSGDLEIRQIGNVDIDTSGSGDVEIETITGSALIETSGSGDFEIDSIAGSLDYRSQGTGDLELDRIGGSGENRVGLKSSGSGDVYIGGGEITELFIDISGSADAQINATVRDVVSKSSGSADIYIDTVTGSVKKTTSGSSDVQIDHRG